jgi:hypothetical protein
MNLASTIDFTLSTGTDGINTLFSPTHQLLYQDWVIFGNYPGGSGNSSSQHSGMNLAGYEIAMQSLNDIHDMFSIMYHAQYSDARQEILITPTPATAGTGLLTVYRKETAENLYNDDMVKRLCVAKAMIQWGRNLGKYEMTMPSGGTIKGSEILSDGKELLEKIMEDIRMESEPLPFWMA